MERIVIVSENPGYDSALFELIRALSPECEISIATRNTIHLETHPGTASSRLRLEDEIPFEGKDTHATDLDHYAG